MKKTLLLSAFLCLFFTILSYAQDAESASIKWMSMEEMEKAHAKEPRKIIIDVYTDWCGWCKRMDKTTFQNPEITRYINEKYYAVKLNAEQKETIKFKDTEFKYVPNGRRGYHELAADLLQGKMSYPSIVYLDENLNMIQPVPGYQDAIKMEQIIKFIGDDHYKTTNFETFQTDFKSAL